MIRINNQFFPEEIQELARKIAEKNGELFLVGGSLRDILLEREPLEYDFEIHASLEKKQSFAKKSRREEERAISLFLDEVLELLGELGPLHEVGKSFGIIKIKGKDYDFSFPRREKKTGEKRQDYLIEINPFLQLKLAQKRRDFTINSLAYSFKEEKIYDNFSGLSDLAQKRIRITDPLTFPEDPLRVYRLAQFISRLDFRPDQETLEICQKVDLENLSLERIEAEMGKLFTGSHLYQAFLFLKESHVLKKRHLDLEELFLEKLEKLTNLDQIIPHLKDSFSFQENFLFFLMHFFDGAFDGTDDFLELNKIEKILGSFSRNLTANRQCLNYLKNLLLIREYDQGFRTRDQLAYDLVGEKTGHLLDYYSLWSPISGDLRELIKEAEEFRPLIDGRDLIEEGFKPSGNFKKKLNEAKELQIAGKNKEEILQILKRKYKNQI